MKNLFFALAFMLIGSFTFANNNTTTEVLNTNTIELTEVTTQEVATDVIVVITIIDYYDQDGEYLGSDVYIDVYIFE
ncbi:hypothetical protein H2O64_08800 [Kordia sp. YSTF-M3]|uniref:Secreted protein n=1 Tax=Kordia aestuariivivens TaxID=2759037 RepID=A0ABR7Q872_9FLAO|nr:hypothetical protein [Kordia aestuariivivens]MBC8754767.1 hypothetical protein [Kordia aestuariivivens]